MFVAPVPFTSPHISLNRVRVVDLPGIPVDDEVRGKLAYHLVSVGALTSYARELAAALQLPASFLEDAPETRSELPRFLNASLSSSDEQAAGAAKMVATRVGRNFGHVLLALHRGDQANREAREDWADADWARWGGIRRIWLAGGLMSGRLGAMIRDCAQGWLDQVGYAGLYSIEASPFLGNTSLVGAARYLPIEAGVALCCDFGQTSAKRAIVSIDGGAITRILGLPAVHMFGARHLDPDADLSRQAARYTSFVVDAVCDAVESAAAHGRDLAGDFVLSVASYVDGGRLLGKGAYATMNLLAPSDVRPMLASAIGGRTGRTCRIHLIHDGTAAAAVFAGEPQAAVIALGTALGVGFPPDTDEGLRDIKAIGNGTLATGDIVPAR